MINIPVRQTASRRCGARLARGVRASLGVGCIGVLVACSSSGHPGNSSGSSTGSVNGSGVGSTAAQVTRAYEIFFSNTSTAAQSQNALQHGERFSSALAAQATSTYAVKSSATVSKVTLISPNSADVVFSVISSGTVVLKDTPGKAARENGVWKVAAQTFCALLTLQGNPPSACSDASVTALPN